VLLALGATPEFGTGKPCRVLCSTEAFGWRAHSPLQAMTVDDGVVRIASGVNVMKIIVSALTALSVLAGIAAPANAADDRWHPRDAGLSSPL